MFVGVDVMIYYPLIATVILLIYGVACYYLQRNEIKRDNKMFRCRPSSKNILIKLKFFKYDWRFNYFLLIPYLLAWTIFFLIISLYFLYWFGIKEIQIILLQNWLLSIIMVLWLIMIIYICIIQQIINVYNGKANNFTKEDEKILKEIMKENKKDKTNK